MAEARANRPIAKARTVAPLLDALSDAGWILRMILPATLLNQADRYLFEREVPAEPTPAGKGR